MQDQFIKCVDCGKEFSWTINEQRWFAARGLVSPKRCKPCRAEKKSLREKAPTVVRCENDVEVEPASDTRKIGSVVEQLLGGKA